MAQNDSTKSKLTKWLVGLGVSTSVALAGGYLIIPHEGEVKSADKVHHVAYKDPVNITTYCWGLTGKDLYGNIPQVGHKYTEEECIKMFIPRIQQFEKDVDRLVKVDYASDYQKASLISFTYNVGIGSLQSSTLIRKLNAGQHEVACEELSRWVYAQKKRLGGLVTRRAEEKAWCLGKVPYEVQITYNEITKMVRAVTEPNVEQANSVKEEKKQSSDNVVTLCKPSDGGFFGWLKYAWCNRRLTNS